MMTTRAEAELSELVACTLNRTDLKSQRERWLAVGANFGRRREEVDDGLRLYFDDHPGIETELQELVAVENECCSWASWSVEREDGALVMAARSRGEGIATLHTMFHQAVPTAGT
jgi:hypothetical protein